MFFFFLLSSLFSALARRSLRFSSLFSLFTGDWWFSFHIFLSSSTTRSTFSRKSFFFPLFFCDISNDLRCFSGEIAPHTVNNVLENSTRILHLSWDFSDLNWNLTDDQKSLSVHIRCATHFKEIRKNLGFFSPKNFTSSTHDLSRIFTLFLPHSPVPLKNKFSFFFLMFLFALSKLFFALAADAHTISCWWWIFSMTRNSTRFSNNLDNIWHHTSNKSDRLNWKTLKKTQKISFYLFFDFDHKNYFCSFWHFSTRDR